MAGASKGDGFTRCLVTETSDIAWAECKSDTNVFDQASDLSLRFQPDILVVNYAIEMQRPQICLLYMQPSNWASVIVPRAPIHVGRLAILRLRPWLILLIPLCAEALVLHTGAE